MSTAARIAGWQHFAKVVAVLGAVCLLYWPTIDSLVTVWQDTERTTYTHGFLIAAMSLYLLWRVRAGLARDGALAEARWQRLLGAALLFVVVLAWAVAYRAGIQIGHQLLLPLIMGLAVLAFIGRGAALTAARPIAFLYFAIPLWDFLIPAAVWATTRSVQLLLGLVGVPAYFSANVVQLSSGTLEISAGCSGLHYIIVARAIAAVLGELRGDGWRMRLRWGVIALLLAVVMNWLRVFIVILAGHLTHMQHYLVRESHYGFGWVLFSGVLVALLLIERRTPLAPLAARSAPDPSAAGRPEFVRQAVAALVLVLPLALNTVIDVRVHSTVAAISWPEPATVSSCAASPGPSDWQPVQHFADHESRTRFLCGNTAVETYAAWYSEQRPHKKLGGYDNRLAGDATIVASGDESVGHRRFATWHLHKDGRDSILWVTYRVGDREFTDPTRAQIWYSVRTLQSLRSPLSGAIAARAECQPDCDAAQAQLVRFINNGGIP